MVSTESASSGGEARRNERTTWLAEDNATSNLHCVMEKSGLQVDFPAQTTVNIDPRAILPGEDTSYSDKQSTTSDLLKTREVSRPGILDGRYFDFDKFLLDAVFVDASLASDSQTDEPNTITALDGRTPDADLPQETLSPPSLGRTQVWRGT